MTGTAPLKGHFYTFHIRSTSDAPIEVYYGNGTCDKKISQIGSRKSKPITRTPPLSHAVPPKSPDRTASRSSTSASSSVSSRSPQHRSKASNTSLHSIRQEDTTTTPTALAVSSKRLVRKGLDVSPAMLEFFGMKPVTGPGACFQLIEEREPPVSKKRLYEEGEGGNKLPVTTNGVDRSNEAIKSQCVKEYAGQLGEPGPELFPGVENSRNKNDDNDVQIMMSEKEEKEEVELGQTRRSKSREEMKRLAKNGLGYDNEQTDEPGPEYFSNVTDGEEGACKIEDEGVNRNDLSIWDGEAREATACSIAKEGGRIGEGLSMMVTTNATTDAMKSSVGGERALLAATAGSTEATVTALPATGFSMDSGTGGTFETILIKGVQIINDDSINTTDVLIQDGIIRELSSKIEERPEAQIIDGTDKVLMPAGIEIYTNFPLPDSVDDFENSSKAALAGGIATIINVIQAKPNETLLNAYDRLWKVAQTKLLCNVAFSVLISEWNEMIRKEMNILVHDKGINSFTIDIQKDEQLFEIFEYCRKLRVHARIIPENKDIIALLEKRMRTTGISDTECSHLSRSELLEADMVNRISVLSKLTNCPVSIMSLSSPGAAEVLLRQRSNMLIPEIPVTALDNERNNLASHNGSLSALISCLASLPLSICTSSGQCEMRKKDSNLENFTRNDVSAVNERMSMVWVKAVLSGMIDPMRFVALTSSNAAKVFNLYPQKGKIAVGADADLVLWKSSMKHETSIPIQDPSLFEVFPTLQKPVMTICGGRIAYSNGKFELGRGKLLHLGSHSPYLYCMLKQINGVQRNGGMNENTIPYGISHAHHKESLNYSTRALPVQSVQKQQFDPFYTATPEETRSTRASTKVLNPPGGRSTGFW